MFQTKFVEKKTHVLLAITFFPRKSCRVRGKVERYCTVGQASDDSKVLAHCMLDT